jgi:hypothetical protein
MGAPLDDVGVNIWMAQPIRIATYDIVRKNNYSEKTGVAINHIKLFLYYSLMQRFDKMMTVRNTMLYRDIIDIWITYVVSQNEKC